MLDAPKVRKWGKLRDDFTRGGDIDLFFYFLVCLSHLSNIFSVLPL